MHGGAVWGLSGEMFGEVESGEVWFKFIFKLDGLAFGGDAGDVFLSEAGTPEAGILEFAGGLADEVIDLIGGDATDLVVDFVNAAGADGEFAFAADGEDAAVSLDFDFFGEFGDGDERGVVCAEGEPAEGFETLGDGEVDLAAGGKGDAEGVEIGVFPVGRDDGRGEEERFFEDFLIDFLGRLPRFIVIFGKMKDAESFLDVFGLGGTGGGDDEDLFGIAVGIADELIFCGGNFKETGDVWDDDFLREVGSG